MATTIDVKEDNREFYVLATDEDDYTLTSVSKLQNQSNFTVGILVNDEKRWILEKNDVIIFPEESKVGFYRTSIETTVGAS